MRRRYARCDARRESEVADVRELPEGLRKEQFFIATAALDDKKVEIRGWHGPKRARELLDEGVAQLKQTQ